jgi:integrase
MAIEKLTDLQVKASKPGKNKATGEPLARLYNDGGGLNLQVTPGQEKKSANKSWLFRFVSPVTGRERRMGLGGYPTIGLAEARGKAADARKMLVQGLDPIDAREAQRASRAVANAKAMTFAQCAAAYVASHRAGWRSPNHAKEWERSVDKYVTPLIGKLPVSSIDTPLVMKVLEPIWATVPETAVRVRGRIESVLDWARVRGFRTGENPARWRGHLDHLLPPRARVRAVKHFTALPYAELPGFMTELKARPATAARALQFTILTAARTNEVLGAKWSELDIKARVWTVPAERMKGGKEHRVPLSGAAMAITEHQQLVRENDFVFPGTKRQRLSHAAMDALLTRMGRTDITVHGTARSAFRDWAAETTDYPNHVVEMALGHVVGSKVEAAYRRGDLFEKRRQLMNDWARYCEPTPVEQGRVVPIRQVG